MNKEISDGFVINGKGQ